MFNAYQQHKEKKVANTTLSLANRYLDKLSGEEIKTLIESKVTPETTTIDLTGNFLGLIINGFDIDDDLQYLGAARRFGDELSDLFLGIPNTVECLNLSRNYMDELRKPEDVFKGIPSSVSSIIMRKNYMNKTPYIDEALTALGSLPTTVNHIDLRDNPLLSANQEDDMLSDEAFKAFFLSIIQENRKIDVDPMVLERLNKLEIALEKPEEQMNRIKMS
ncbi:MAG: hypothetical protein RLZ35_636 [Pseudomonadota bacterium]|jgi:hypothetical protein